MQPAVVAISSPADLVGILPHRLGFHPTESLVVVSLHGERRRDELVMRFDLPGPGEDHALADEVAERLAGRGADAAALVCVTEGPLPRAGLPRAPLVRAVRRGLRARDVELTVALLVRDGRWSSYLCDGACCPIDGTPLPSRPSPVVSRYAAEAVGRGGAVLPDRDALARSIEALPGVADADVAAAALGPAFGPLERALAAGPTDMRVLRRVTGELVVALLARWVEGLPTVDAREAALLAESLTHKTVRDEVMTLVLDHPPLELTGLLAEIARHTPDACAAPVCSVLAWCAWAAGDGALTAVAAERALRVEPGYAMAGLVLQGLSAMAPPAVVREVSAAVRADLALGDAMEDVRSLGVDERGDLDDLDDLDDLAADPREW